MLLYQVKTFVLQFIHLGINSWNSLLEFLSFHFIVLRPHLSITSKVCFENTHHMLASYGVSSSTLTVEHNVQLFCLIKYCL